MPDLSGNCLGYWGWCSVIASIFQSLALLTLGIFSVALSTAVLPALSRFVAERNESQVREILADGR